MKQLPSQLAFDFASSGSLPGEGGEQHAQEATRIGVRVRLKSLKNAPAAQPEEEAAAPAPAMPSDPELPQENIRQVDLEEAIGMEKPDKTIEELPELPAEHIQPATETEGLLINMKGTRSRSKISTAEAARPVKSKRGRKSLKQIAAEADLINIPSDEVLFSKQYYTMGEVAEMFRVNQSLLRFWETEFNILQPRKNRKGDRYFRPIDIKNLHLIYHLLRHRKYTIEGAKDFLKKNKKADQRFETIQRLQEIKAFLLELKAQL